VPAGAAPTCKVRASYIALGLAATKAGRIKLTHTGSRSALTVEYSRNADPRVLYDKLETTMRGRSLGAVATVALIGALPVAQAQDLAANRPHGEISLSDDTLQLRSAARTT
jgi:hypothetical protein